MNKNFVVFVTICFATIIFLTFGLTIAFGNSFYDVREIGIGLHNTFLLIFANFNYPDLENSDPDFGALLFIVMVFFVGVILMNMFIAVLSDTYTQLQEKNSEIWEITITLLMIQEAVWARRFGFYVKRFIQRRMNAGQPSAMLVRDMSVSVAMPDREHADLETDDQEEPTEKTEDDIFDMVLEYNHGRRQKDTLEIYQFVDEFQNRTNAEFANLQTQMQQIKTMLEEIRAKK